jgi:ATP-binding cassette subfamily B protein/ATP-binding cassette subfamily C protein LapB
MKRNKEASGTQSFSRFKLNFFNSLIENGINTITTISAAATIFLGIQLVRNETLSPAAIIISTILLGKILQPFQITATSLPKIQQFYSVIKQLNKLMDIRTEYNEESIKKKKVENLNGALILNRVGVKFNKDSDPIFTSLNLNVNAGETIALTGLNGSGKSTLLKLINGMYKPQIGSISIDGYDIRQVSATNLRRSIAYAPQNPQFFQGSIIENIRMGNPLATASQVDYVIEELQLMDELKHIPEGLNAQVNSELLSKTQSTLIYKLALARTMISNSNIVLIDELPFSILSGPIGDSIYQFIENCKGHRTTIFVSNSENFIKLSDKAVFLQRNHSPLIADPESILKEVNREKVAA